MNTHSRLCLLLGVLLLIAACGSAAPSVPPGTGLAITAAAGPVCPVERVPPDPACAPRPVGGATVLILDGQGKTVATVVLDDQGLATAALAPGTYVVQAQPANGLMGTPGPENVTIVAGVMTPVLLAYDTGIR